MTAAPRSPGMTRYGSNAPLPERRTLRAGPVTAVLEHGDLRYVTVGGVEIVRRLYMAVRDRNWATIPPRFVHFSVSEDAAGFRVELEAEHVSADVDFAWRGVIEGHPDGTIRYTLDGAPRKRFFRNRIGFCVLHPSNLAGLRASTETPAGTVDGVFPDHISPHQPFIDMHSISHAGGPDRTVTIRFTGDLFEMEDQRNWTDASYKTYGTPLRIPYPVEVDPSTRISQSVTISVAGGVRAGEESASERAPQVTVDFGDTLPLPPIGFGAGRKGTLYPDELDAFQALQPAHLWLGIDLSSESWRRRLTEASGRASALGARLDLSVVAASGDGDWQLLAWAIREESVPLGRVFVFPAVDEPVVFPRFDLATHPETIDAARKAFEAVGVSAALGGGARAYFTELNRAMDFLPVDALDAATYTINPQVHAEDTLSVIETLSAQAETVRSGRALVGDTPLVVGPVTFKPPWNPNATGPAPEPGEDELPAPVDPRQLSLFGAGWTLGSIHRLAAAGADALTYYELHGWRGLVERRDGLSRRSLFPSEPGQLFPLYHVFAAVAEFRGGSIAQVELSDPLATEALALESGDKVRVLVGSFSNETMDVELRCPGLLNSTLRMLDEATYDAAMHDRTYLMKAGEPLVLEDGVANLTLRPFAIACIDGNIA